MRTLLYLTSLRNIIGKALGMGASAYTAQQIAVAKAIFDFWAARGCDPASAAAFVGCAEGETSLLISARGDHGEAGGIAQWHAARRDAILAHTGNDVWSADLKAQLAGQFAEVTAPWSPYRHVFGRVAGVPDLTGKVRVLVHDYEQSGSQDRDVARRTPMAARWLAHFSPGASA